MADTEPQGLGEVVDALVRGTVVPLRASDLKVSSNPDINYLAARSGLPEAFLRRCRRIFGEPVLLESLRRTLPGWSEPVFFGICRNVERALKEEA